jgi:hypothetical protein
MRQGDRHATFRQRLLIRAELMAAHEVFVGDVPQRGVRSVALAIEVFDIAVDVLFATMKLSVETALSVGYWSDVVDRQRVRGYRTGQSRGGTS